MPHCLQDHHTDPPLISSAPCQPCQGATKNQGNHVKAASCRCLLARGWAGRAPMPTGAGAAEKPRAGRGTAQAGEVLPAPAPGLGSAAGGSPQLSAPLTIFHSPFPLSSRKLPANKTTAAPQFPFWRWPAQGGPASPSCQEAPPWPHIPPFPQGQGFPAAHP